MTYSRCFPNSLNTKFFQMTADDAQRAGIACRTEGDEGDSVELKREQKCSL
jgi:hypothetical protein